MKKMFLLGVVTVIATASFSQVRFGAQVIGNAGNASFKSPEIKNSKSALQPGFGAGIAADIAISNKFSIRPSLNFLQKKNREEYQIPVFGNKQFKVNSNLNYLELPVNVVYKIPVNNMTAYVGAGPSVGYGISGKIKVNGWDYVEGEGENPGEIVAAKQTLDAFKKENKGGAGMQRFEVSANALAGVEFKNGLYINAGYMAGLTNLIKEQTYKHRSILLTVGFMLPSYK